MCELLEASDLYSAAQSIVQDCKLLHAGRVDEVNLLLEEAQRRQQGGEEAQSPTSGAFACLQQPGNSFTAPHAVSEADRQQLHEEQQQYLQAAAASATQAMAAAAGSARLSRIDEYLVSVACCSATSKVQWLAAERHVHRVSILKLSTTQLSATSVFRH